jgi:hypothetical protein
MKIHDLADLIPFSSLLDVARTKLNGTYVQYEGEWMLVYWVADSLYYADDKAFKYGKGKFWIHLQNDTGVHIKLNTLEGIVTEPEWPDAGWYYYDHTGYRLSYSRGSVYKAGLSGKQFQVYKNEMQVSNAEKLKLLNSILNGESIYPTIKDTTELLLTTQNRYVPINDRVIVSAHPYIDGPVAYYNDNSIGTIEDDYIKLNETNEQLTEYLDHAGVKYACN